MHQAEVDSLLAAGVVVVVSMPLATARGWDLSGILPGPDPATPTG